MRFDPLDFPESWDQQYAADCANAKLEEWLRNAPEILLTAEGNLIRQWQDTGAWARMSASHKGRVVCIEEIK